MKIKKLTLTISSALVLFTTAGTTLVHADTDVSAADTTSSIQTNQNKTNKLVRNATKFTGLRYIWGGTTKRGFDCSGFTQYNYRRSMKINLPRTAQAQYNFGAKVSETNAQKGDLVFFGSSSSNIDHVGIYLGNGKMIDSQNRGVVTENVHAPWWNLVGYAHYGD